MKEKSPFTLCSLLVLLATSEVSPRERNDAATRLLAEVRRWAGHYVRTVVRPCPLDDDDVEEIVQLYLTVCCTGTARFRGTTEPEARVWTKRVLCSSAYDVVRHKRRFRRDEGGEEPEVGRVDPELRTLVADDLVRIVRAIVAELGRLHRPHDVERQVRNFCCHYEARLGATIQEQLRAYGDVESFDRSPEADRRARDRVFKYRERGRLVGCEALASLVARGAFLAEEVEAVRRLIACDLASPIPERTALS